MAEPFQFATGSNLIVPSLAATIVSPGLTTASGSPAFSVPCALSGSVTIVTDFSMSPLGSLNASVKSFDVNVSGVFSAVVLLMAPAVGRSPTAIVTVADAADSLSRESVTL